jgi:hypothetical protein
MNPIACTATRDASGGAGSFEDISFHIEWTGVPDISESTLCGHVGAAQSINPFDASSEGTLERANIVAGSVDCSTQDFGNNQNTITLDFITPSDSCQFSVGAIQRAVQDAVETKTATVNLNPSDCGCTD